MEPNLKRVRPNDYPAAIMPELQKRSTNYTSSESNVMQNNGGVGLGQAAPRGYANDY